MEEKWRTTILVLILLGILSMFMSSIISIMYVDLVDHNTAIIKVSGVIVSDTDSVFRNVASATEIVEQIEKADNNPMVRAMLIEINSPGGSPVASKEIAAAIKNSNKTTVAWIREIGASGAYWIASSTDYIIADELSITGSIGVQGSYLEFSGLLEQYNITYNRLVAGKYKDLGSPVKPLTTEEEQYYQNILSEIHEIFIEAIAQNRDLEISIVQELATGMVYLGKTAVKIGLIDQTGGKQEALDYIQLKINETPRVKVYEKQAGFFESLSVLSATHGTAIGRGIVSSLAENSGILRLRT